MHSLLLAAQKFNYFQGVQKNSAEYKYFKRIINSHFQVAYKPLHSLRYIAFQLYNLQNRIVFPPSHQNHESINIDRSLKETFDYIDKALLGSLEIKSTSKELAYTL